MSTRIEPSGEFVIRDSKVIVNLWAMYAMCIGCYMRRIDAYLWSRFISSLTLAGNPSMRRKYQMLKPGQV